mmetsp:Transcript_64279/g.196653  ORF Transcript_64279/g.196653 Transcript_64279/m.196653 type:complete len:233 (+) Transcript_64279:1427-2125(+)
MGILPPAIEMQGAANFVRASKFGGVAQGVVDVVLNTLLLGPLHEKVVQVGPGDRVEAFRIILPVRAENGLAAWHVDDPPTLARAPLLQEVLAHPSAQLADRPEAATRQRQVDGPAAGARKGARVPVALEDVDLEALPAEHHSAERAHKSGANHDDVLPIACADRLLLGVGEGRALVRQVLLGAAARCGLRRGRSGALRRGVRQVLDRHQFAARPASRLSARTYKKRAAARKT